MVALVVIIPLMAADVLPAPDTGKLEFMTVVTPPEPPPPPVTVARVPDKPAPDFNPNAAPIEPPDRISDEIPLPPANYVIGVGDAIGSSVGVPDSVGFGIPVPARPEPPPPQPPTRPVRPGGAIREPVKVRNVAPVYPAIAQAARISGIVTIEAVIGTDGIVRDARIVSGVALLNQAALDAVRQWRYTPTTLNGVPVQVLMTVRVAFEMNSR
jgi:protein TonB